MSDEKNLENNSRQEVLDVKDSKPRLLYVEGRPRWEYKFLRRALLDDQSIPTRNAINVMQSNALLGLLLVILVTWVFLGWQISMFIGIGIPFTLAATFWMLSATGQTLNQSVLLAIVIVLGMLVDDGLWPVHAEGG